jgi:hypothetical protein
MPARKKTHHIVETRLVTSICVPVRVCRKSKAEMMIRTWVHAGVLQLIFLFKCLEYTTGMYIYAYNGCKTPEIVKERCSLKSQELQTLCQA